MSQATNTQFSSSEPSEMIPRAAVARKILEVQPELLSLQEVDQWYTGSFDPVAGTCGSMTLAYDMLQELLGALSARGGHYEVAVQVTQNAFPPLPGLVPPADYICVAVTDYNIILARTDLPPSIFHWSNPQSGQFVNELVFPTPLGSLPAPRSWASVDAQFFGHAFHYINTHLESFDPTIRELQGGELRAGPANTSLPVIIGMDSNAQAFPLPEDPTYVDFISAGYDDVWSRLFPVWYRDVVTGGQRASTWAFAMRLLILVSAGSPRFAAFRFTPLPCTHYSGTSLPL
jgi:hypothetical protein